MTIILSDRHAAARIFMRSSLLGSIFPLCNIASAIESKLSDRFVKEVTSAVILIIASLLLSRPLLAQDGFSVPPITLYRIEVMPPGEPSYHSGTNACARIMEYHNRNSRHSVQRLDYSNAEFGVHPDYGDGCYFDLTARGGFGGYAEGHTWRQHYQNWVLPQDVCLADYNPVFILDQNSNWRLVQCDRKPVVKSKPRNCPVDVGNPIACDTGEKIERAFDQLLENLSISRTFRSGLNFDGQPMASPTGVGWHTFLSSRVDVSNYGEGTAFVTRPDGTQVVFTKVAEEWRTDSDLGRFELGKMSADEGESRGWRFTSDGINVEYYNESGSLELIENKIDPRQNIYFRRDQHGRVDRISTSSERSVSLFYDDWGLLTRIDSPESTIVSYQYDSRQRLSRVVKPGGEISYLYEDVPLALGIQLIGIVDEHGVQFATFTYDDVGRAISTSHAGDVQRYSIHYSGDTVVDVATPEGGSRHYEFSAINGVARLIGSTDVCTDCSHGSSVITYSPTGHQSSILRSDGSRSYYSRNARGRIIDHSIFESGASAPISRASQEWSSDNSGIVRREVSDGVGNILALTEWERNSRGQIEWEKHLGDGALRSTRFDYCESSDVDAGTCPLIGVLLHSDGPVPGPTDRTSHSYYSSDHSGCATSPAACQYRKGDLWKVTTGLGQVTETLAYDGAGRTKSVKDPNGVITDYEYHARGWLTAVKVRGTNNSAETDDRITLIEYWPTGLIKKVTLPMGAVTNYTYDAAHRLTQVSDNAGNKIVYTLDNAGNRIKEEVKHSGGTLKATLSRVYNQLGQLATAADARANPTDFTYDANGNAIGTEDALGRSTSYAFDALNRLKESIHDTAGIQAKTAMKYNALDQVTEVTDPKGLKTTYKYNGFGDLTELKSPDTGTTTYTYDEAGNVKTAKDARGKTATYAYDGLNRVISIGYGNTALNVTYGYDTAGTACASGETFAKGRLSSMIDGAGTTQYCYNRFGELVRKVQTINGVSLTLRYTYAANGNLTGMVYPDNTVVDYTRDVQGRVTAVGVTRPAASREVVLSQASYHPFGPVAGWTYGNGRTMTRPVDLDYRPLAIIDSATDGLQVGFGYDPVGNLTSLNSATNTTPQLTIGYDALGRLTSLSDPNTAQPLEAYTYDATGNRTSAKQNGVTKAYTYASTSHRLTNVGGLARSYAADGSTTALGGTTKQYTYDDTGRMQQAKNGSTVVMNYRYNGRGERTRAYLGSANTYTLYDEAGHWLGDYGNNGAVIQQAIWVNDLPVGVVTTAKTHYIQPDHLGTPRAVIDPASNKAIWSWSIRGEAFGATAPNEDPDQDGQAFVFNLRFPGQRYDAVSGLSYNYFRDYEPATGRYVQSDPVGLSGGVSTYGYVGSSALSFTDPLGLQRGIPVTGPVGGPGYYGGSGGYYDPSSPYNTGTNGETRYNNIQLPVLTDAINGYAESAMSSLGQFSRAADAASSPAERAEKAAQRKEYSRICKSPSPPTGDPCQDAKNNLQRLKTCLGLREAFSQRWYGDQDLGHMIEINNTRRAVNKAEDDVLAKCGNQCL